MKTTVASYLWTRTLTVQFLYPVQYYCIWILSASKCPNVKAWSLISGCGTNPPEVGALQEFFGS